jgi:hypothetical protein
MPRETLFANWAPEDLIQAILRTNKGEFDQRFGSTIFLVIKLRGHPPTLREDLNFIWNASNSAVDRPADDLGFFTQTFYGSPQTGTSKLDPPGLSKSRTLPLDLIDDECFLAPIRKRKGSDSFLNTVTIGRTRNHDIVLRDSSVSKFHASLNVEGTGSLLVKDAGSKNKTRVKGVVISKQTAAVSGDEIQFGSIETVVCDAVCLWNTIEAA